ncbi:MAG: hypothetical protein WC962_09175, partial [Phycisphaerae bacterium]
LNIRSKTDCGKNIYEESFYKNFLFRPGFRRLADAVEDQGYLRQALLDRIQRKTGFSVLFVLRHAVQNA